MKHLVTVAIFAMACLVDNDALAYALLVAGMWALVFSSIE